ncbi:TraB/GumN family protein [Arcicella sp. DC2W]|uniref:TraB/GumN family protein n=1 Tax=Arcicella gelida TaxID=2984195 RepID=A0ABU5S1A0_9BACT|nr:TraB/GumN family protein [Arcicella sp. DC2W]MEA5402253.1 TraB/GumN family protein [Arcicella sp. DC2W]
MKLIYKHLAFILLLFYSTNSSAQSVLWIVEGNGLEKPSYIFGSVHEMCKQNLKWDIEIENITKVTNRVFFDLNLSLIMQTFKHKGSKKMLYGYSLNDLYSEEDYKEVSEYFEGEYKINIEKEKRFSPMDLMFKAIQKGKKGNCKKKTFYHYKITKLYKESYYLPLNVNQVPKLDSIPERDFFMIKRHYQKYADVLLQMIRKDKLNKTFPNTDDNQLIDSYYKMDIDEIKEISNKYPSMNNFEDSIVSERIKIWLGIMPSIMEEKPSFFVVDVAHLGGNNGIINSLKDEGYTVRPLKMTWDKKL